MADIKNNNSSVNEFPVQNESFEISFEKECEGDCSSEAAVMQIEENSKESSIEKKHNPHLDAFMKELDHLSLPEAKVRHALAFMENSLSQSGTPHFKSFWDVRNICLQLFKENLPPALRAQFWAKYSELSKEARRLKELLDEQSSFAAEQIEIAITALENEIAQFDEQVNKTEIPDLGGLPKLLLAKKAFYENTQRRLNLLNVQASRINALRKELIKTEMRVRQKNKFFQRLSAAGDKIFPLRKDLIKDVSAAFSEDVEAFLAQSFGENFHEALFVLREEIKNLQGIAKILTLNTHAFTHTRLSLSECWDKIKNAEKERKKERAQQKVIFKQNFDAVKEKIEECKKRYEEGALSDDQAQKQLEEISKYMRQIELGREEVRPLRDELSNVRNLVLEKAKAQEEVRAQQEHEREKHRKAKVDELKEEMSTLSQRLGSFNAQELVEIRDEFIEKVQTSSLNKFERQEIERVFKPIRNAIADALSEKEEQALMSLSDDDRHAIEQLKEALKQRKERRQEIKDALRKAGSASGLDFEKAMSNRELVNQEKERLEKINQGIKEIEDRIYELQKKR